MSEVVKLRTSRCDRNRHGRQPSGQRAECGCSPRHSRTTSTRRSPIPQCKAIVLTCAGRTFIAGADITEFGKPPQPPALNDVI